jgi:hypothetical protein
MPPTGLEQFHVFGVILRGADVKIGDANTLVVKVDRPKLVHQGVFEEDILCLGEGPNQVLHTSQEVRRRTAE